MILTTNIKYKIILVEPDGKQLNITELAEESCSFGTTESELANKIQLSCINESINGKTISSRAKLYAHVGILANGKEVARGRINTWKNIAASDETICELEAHDDLLLLEKSNGNIFIPQGTRTRAAIEQIFSAWDLTIGKFTLPQISHEKKAFRNKSIHSMLDELLDDVKKQTGIRGVIRATMNDIDIIAEGSNDLVYVLKGEINEKQVDEVTITDLVTQVLIVGKADDAGRTPIINTKKGRLEFGLRQQILDSDEKDPSKTLNEAEELLQEKGKPERTITINATDIPWIQKGDQVYIDSNTLKGYFIVRGVTHDIGEKKMSLDIKEEGAV